MKRVTGISWKPEVLAALDAYAKSLLGATDAGHRSAIVNNLVARELRRLGFPAKFAEVKRTKK